eukprot:sb/3470911/
MCGLTRSKNQTSLVDNRGLSAAMSVVESCTLPAPSTAPSTTPTATSQPISGIYIDWYTAGVAAGLVLAFLGLLKVVRLFPYTYVIQQSDIRYRRAGRTSTNETTLTSTVVIFDPAEEEFAAMSVVESCTLPAPSTAPSTTPTATSQPISGIYIDWYTAGVAAGLVLAQKIQKIFFSQFRFSIHWKQKCLESGHF